MGCEEIPSSSKVRITVGGEFWGKTEKRMEEIVDAGQVAVMLSWRSLYYESVSDVSFRHGGGGGMTCAQLL